MKDNIPSTALPLFVLEAEMRKNILFQISISGFLWKNKITITDSNTIICLNGKARGEAFMLQFHQSQFVTFF